MAEASAARAGPALREWLLLVAFVAAVLGYWLQQGRLHALPEPAGERVECLSYAPFRLPGETPFDPSLRIARQRIEADLRLLATRTGCVRTYSIDQGLAQVPAVARELGMEVLLGVWIGRERERNRRELARAIELVRAEPSAIRALVVGNEVLLRRELPEAELRALITQARSAVTIPVTYADVWEFWLEHPRLAGAVDFVTIHILPYWEDEPIGIDQAVTHVTATYRLAQDALPGRPILIGETGWPRAGRARGEAVPGRVEQARFVREFTRTAQREQLPYNLIEAFDQPWKRRLEGAMGGHWGLYTRDGAAAFPWHGPIREDPRWRDGLLGMALGALGFGMAAALAGRHALGFGATAALAGRHVPGTGWCARAALAGAALGGVLVAQWRHALAWQAGAFGWTVAALGALLAVAYGWLALGPAAGIHAGTAAPGIHALVGGWTRQRRIDAAGALSLLRFTFLFCAAATVLLLAFDARYRSFPWPAFAAPLGAALLLAARGARLPADAREERALGVVIALGALPVLWMETLANREALAFLLGLVLYAGACLMPAGTRSSASMPASAPSTAGSKE